MSLFKPEKGQGLNFDHTVNSGLLLCMPTVEGSGSKTFNLIGNQNNGTLTNGPTWEPSEFGGSIGFNGSTSYISLDSNPTPSYPFTVCTWVVPGSLSDKQSVYCSATTGVNVVFDSVDNQILSGIAGGKAANYNSDIAAGKPVHVAFVFRDGSTDQSVYINSVDLTVASTEWWGSGSNRIGSGNARHYWDGLIDEVRIYNRALNAFEVKLLSQRPPELYEQQDLSFLFAALAGLAIIKSISDPIGITDSASRILSLVRQNSESIGVSDTTIRAIGLSRTESESIGITDTVTRKVGIFRTISDTVGITDLAGKVFKLVKKISDSIGISDTSSRIIAYVRSKSESVGVTDSVSRSGFAIIKSIADSIGITDVVVKTLNPFFQAFAKLKVLIFGNPRTIIEIYGNPETTIKIYGDL
jgi:hypothetical protein